MLGISQLYWIDHFILIILHLSDVSSPFGFEKMKYEKSVFAHITAIGRLCVGCSVGRFFFVLTDARHAISIKTSAIVARKCFGKYLSVCKRFGWRRKSEQKGRKKNIAEENFLLFMRNRSIRRQSTPDQQ